MKGGGPNTSVVHHAGRTMALVETRLPMEVGGELETVGPHDFGSQLSRAMSAHPKICPTTGELVFISYGAALPYLVVYRADAQGRIVHQAPIRVPSQTYLHDIGITERHVVFWDLPVLVGDWRSPQPLRWSDDYPPRIGVLPRGGQDADVRWFDVEACTISHTMNAFEDGDLVVLDVVRGPRLMTAHALYRFELDLRTGKVKEGVLHPRFMDFPRVAPAAEGRPYRHGYAVELSDFASGGWQASTPRKVDVAAGTSVAHDFGPTRMSDELVFVPREGATAEDDGYVMGFVHDRARGASDLVILDAQRFDEAPLATVRLPCRVPVGIHGTWIPTAPGANQA